MAIAFICGKANQPDLQTDARKGARAPEPANYISNSALLQSWLQTQNKLQELFYNLKLQPYLQCMQSVITANGRHKVPFPELVVGDKPGWRQQDERRAQGLAGMLAAQISAACAAASAGAPHYSSL